jgi:hypothetical protein
MYAQVKAFPETQKFLSSQKQIERAQNRHLSHWASKNKNFTPLGPWP